MAKTGADARYNVEHMNREVMQIGPDATEDEVLSLRERISAARARLKDIAADLDQSLIEWIDLHGEITYGTHRLYVGTKRTTRCVDVPGTVRELLESTGGDFDVLCQTLSAQPIKHGAAKAYLAADAYGRLFKTETKEDLKTGQARRQVIEVDTRFLHGDHDNATHR